MKPSEIYIKMEALSDHITNPSQDKSDECSLSENIDSEPTDPLIEVNKEISEPRYYRMDSIVFAQPSVNILNMNPSKDLIEVIKEEEFIFKDNVVVQKRSGKKYKKYHFNIEDLSKLICPQPNCASTFLTTKLLKAHIRKVHCADKAYICELCGAGFCAQYLLVRHTAVHTKKRVTCHICSKTLSERTNLSTHLRSHSGDRPYSCDVCNKSFIRASTLAAHVKFVHREGLLGCDQCEERFSSRKQWTQHVASHRRRTTSQADTS